MSKGNDGRMVNTIGKLSDTHKFTSKGKFSFIKKLSAVIVFLLIWQGAAYLAGSVVFPGAWEVVRATAENAGAVLIHGGFSLYRIAAGIAAALAVGVPLGILMGYSQKAGEVLSPVAYIAGPVPKVALLPLFMLTMGIGELPKLFIIFIVMVFQVIISVRDGVKSIPKEYFIPYYAAKAPTGKIISDILIPASAGGIFSAVRVGVATAISVLFFAETFGTRYGMGFYIMDSWTRLEYARMYGGILLLGLMGLGIAKGLDLLEVKTVPHK